MTSTKRKSRIIQEMQETIAGLNKHGVISKKRALEPAYQPSKNGKLGTKNLAAHL